MLDFAQSYGRSVCTRPVLDRLVSTASSRYGSSSARLLALWSVAIAIGMFTGRSSRICAEDETPRASKTATIEELPAGETVQFERDVLPLLERSCLACHNATNAEADVVLESADAMLAYDANNPLIVPGDASAGKLLHVAAGLQEPVMPPEDNDVGALPLTPSELGRIKRWLELGAPSDDGKPSDQEIHWRPIQSDREPIMATTVTSRGAFALAAYGNAVELYNLPRNRRITPLVDTSLREVDSNYAEAAHRDAVRSLATFDNGERIATGGYRTVKLWRRVRNKEKVAWPASAPVSAMTTSEDRDWIATGHEDGSVTLGRCGVDASTCPPKRWSAHAAEIIELAFEIGGDQLVSVAADGSVKRWELATLNPLGDWRVSPPPQQAGLLAGGLLAMTSDDLSVRIYSLPVVQKNTEANSENDAPAAALELVHQLRGHGRESTTLAAVGNRRLLLTGSRDGFVRLWDAEAGAEKRSWIHGEAVVAVAVQNSGAHFVSVDDKGVTKMWAMDKHEPTWTTAVDDRSEQRLIRAEHSVQLASANVELFQNQVAAARQQQKTDEDRLVAAESAVAEKTKSLSDAAAAAEAARVAHEAAIDASQEAGNLAATSQKTREALRQVANDLQARLSEVDAILEQAVQNLGGDETESEVADVNDAHDDVAQEDGRDSEAPLEQIIDGLSKAVEGVRASEQRRELLDLRLGMLVEALADRIESSERIKKLAKQVQQASEDVAAAQRAVADAKDLLRRTNEGVESARLVVQRTEERLVAATQSLEANRLVLSMRRAKMPISSSIISACFSSDGEHLFFTTQDGDTSLFHVDGTPLGQWKAAAGDVTCAQLIGNDGKIALAQQSAASLTIWSTRPTWNLEQALGDPDSPMALLEGRVLALDFSADGRLLAIGGGTASRNGQVVIWDLRDDRLHCQLERPHDDVVLGIAFSHDGQYLATASADRLMKVWDVNDASLVRSFEGHTHHVLDVAWRANGLELATASADKSLKLWDFERGEQKRSFISAGKELTGVEYLGISGQLVSVSGDGFARIYNSDDGAAVRTISASGDYLLSCDAAELSDLIVLAGVHRILRVYNGSDGAERNNFAVGNLPKVIP